MATEVPNFLWQAFNTECDNVNRPPSLNIILRSLQQLTYTGSDIRGRFVDHPRLGSMAQVAHSIGRAGSTLSAPVLTPLAAYCIGEALGSMLAEQYLQDEDITIVIGRDPRLHGMRLADAFARGAESNERVRVVYTGLATTPACNAFLRLREVQASVMITASHLPQDRNGFKMFFADTGLMTRTQLEQIAERAQVTANRLYSGGTLPPSSGADAVMCSEWANWMPDYAAQLKASIVEQAKAGDRPLEGLKIVLNAGNGAGGFFADVLAELGADVSSSIGIDADGTFPSSVPNPEYKPMIDETIQACRQASADIGIMLDTDADRCGLVVGDGSGDYCALNRNRLIALVAVMFGDQPGAGIVTDSVTSEGLADFITNLGLKHVRFVKGYANVINKAKELTVAGVVDAQVAMETSGHCAMRENDYSDDGTYTAVKVVSLLAKIRKEQPNASLLDMIANLRELDEVSELRLTVKDESLATMQQTFDFCALELEQLCSTRSDWELDVENLEGVRVRVGTDGSFFMLRKSLHDPIISLQIESSSKDAARSTVVAPLLALFASEPSIESTLSMDVLEAYLRK